MYWFLWHALLSNWCLKVIESVVLVCYINIRSEENVIVDDDMKVAYDAGISSDEDSVSYLYDLV
jgi:hypothetical protein